MDMKPWRSLALVAVAVAVLAGLGLVFTPDIAGELSVRLGRSVYRPPPSPLKPTPPGVAAGIVVNGYWRVQQIAPETWAIGEPANDPDNYEYLLAGKTRALLIDSGSTPRDIHPALAALTRLPITVIPTHLHSDHTNGLRNFDRIALVDLPETRALLRGGKVHMRRLQFMAPTSIPTPVFTVSEWIKPDSEIDLGGRTVRLLWTPGHTATSIAIWDPAVRLVFTGDYIYTTTLYAFMPDSSLTAYQATAERLLKLLPADTIIYGAHCCRNDAPPQAPWLAMSDLRDVRNAVAAIRSGQAHGRGGLLRRFPVNSRMTMTTFYPFGDH
jgi:glyoxylase-like metal-dependent hydrolase (beta-lactamase superfamily II)